MGIFSFVHKHAVTGYQEELQKLIEHYSKIDKKHLADYFVFSVWTRAGLQSEGHFKLPDGQASLSSDVSYFMLSSLQNAVKIFKKRGNRTEADALSIWVHTARGVVNQELEQDLKRLWALILDTKEYWQECLDKIYQEDKSSGMNLELLEKTLLLSKKILENVPPERFK